MVFETLKMIRRAESDSLSIFLQRIPLAENLMPIALDERINQLWDEERCSSQPIALMQKLIPDIPLRWSCLYLCAPFDPSLSYFIFPITFEVYVILPWPSLKRRLETFDFFILSFPGSGCRPLKDNLQTDGRVCISLNWHLECHQLSKIPNMISHPFSDIRCPMHIFPSINIDFHS